MTFEELRDRRGKFAISHRMIETAPGACIELMRGMLITRAESSWCSRVIEYEALSPEFDAIPDGWATPEYTWQFEEGKPPTLVKP